MVSIQRAPIAERLGEVPRAVEGYQHIVGMWWHADPELQPLVAEAREALGPLTAEPRRSLRAGTGDPACSGTGARP
jgi:hypothetical protein